MSNYLVIVESPAKAKTIGKYLGKEFNVLASYGHIRDLLPKKGSVDPSNHFKMKYDAIEKNSKHIDKIIKALEKCDALYLATDPDREGEAISWHLSELLHERDLLHNKPVKRVVFHEITQNAIQHAVENPREISMALVNAQQARRALDYLVGFNLSPLLWKKIRRGLSAGRVQSPALRMICSREEEIEKFKSREYWTFEASVASKNQPFSASLTHFDGDKLEQFSITDSKTAENTKKKLIQAANGTLRVIKVDKKQRKRNPASPFITSTLQQEAVRKLGFTAQRTMRTAQQLYEGVDTGAGAEGLITYMRTDSVMLAKEAVEEIRTYIGQKYGANALPDVPKTYKTKSKNAQEAHEAIRPTSAMRDPDSIEAYLTKDQYKLYDLIWKRTIACQMIHATIDGVSVDLAAGETDKHIFRATGSTIKDPGFMQVYQEDFDDDKLSKTKENRLPALKKEDVVNLNELAAEQHFTEPPPRFTEASLIKALEEFGIGRPSTYASIISTLQQREYVVLDKKRFEPTDVGKVVHKFLGNYFEQYVDYDFTAHLEDELDAVSRGEKVWVPLLEEFWVPFHKRLSDVEENVKRSDVTTETLDEKCPKCQKQVAIRLGRRGRFVGCSGYPECDYTRSLDEDASASEQQQEIIQDRKCPACQSDLVIKPGRYGKFIGCSNYPECKHMEPLEKPKETHINCPVCKKGQILERKSRKGRVFYSCEQYPKCKYAIWNPPIGEPCPKCHWPIITLKTTKRRGEERVCPQQGCDYIESVS
jgi:DNA topoisomerase-1